VLDEGRVSPRIPNVSVASLTGASVGAGRLIPPPLGWQVLLGAHVCPLGHVPQLSVPPQPSGIVPQEFAGQVFGVHVCVTHTLFVQVALTGHVPQLSVLPQPSEIVPQFLACAEHVVGVQPPPAWHVPFVHVWPTGHAQVIWPPQPSDTVPHLLPTPPEPHVIGTHAGWHVPLLVPVHVSPLVQAQLSVPPHPFGIVPQLSPVFPAGQVLTVHPHWLAVPPPPQVCGAVHVPQFTVPPWPSGIVPQLAFAAMHRAGPPDVPVEHADGFVGGVGM
jgi:hypothetical protein